MSTFSSKLGRKCHSSKPRVTLKKANNPLSIKPIYQLRDPSFVPETVVDRHERSPRRLIADTKPDYENLENSSNRELEKKIAWQLQM